MHIEDFAIVIELSEFQEKSLIANCFSREHGMIKGFIKSKKSAAQVSVGSIVKVIYKARLQSHLGSMQIENVQNFASMIAFNRGKICLLQSAIALMSKVVIDMDAHETLFDSLLVFLKALTYEENMLLILKQYVLLELEMLASCGYGLDLEKCVVTESKEDLYYISPKSGCAVSKAAGSPYHNKLFKMPSFFTDKIMLPCTNEIVESIEITGYFLEHRVFRPSNAVMPKVRNDIKNLLCVGYDENIGSSGSEIQKSCA